MNDEPKRRGRPPREVCESIETPFQEATSSHEDDMSIAETAMEIKESPIEEKIHQLVEDASIPDAQGWESNMRIAPVDGRRIMVSQTGIGQGVLVYWRISKVVDRKKLRYIPKGRWTDFLSKKDIEFSPIYWKPYNPEEYWPLTVGS